MLDIKLQQFFNSIDKLKHTEDKNNNFALILDGLITDNGEQEEIEKSHRLIKFTKHNNMSFKKNRKKYSFFSPIKFYVKMK
jgi:hypothetical protein